MSKNLSDLRTLIQESLRVQRGSAEKVAYIDTGNVLSDVCARQNHVIFARRGCGKTLLLHYSARRLREGVHSVYLNCEEFKRHSFPNVLIEILDALFAELEKHLSAWFGRKKRSKELIRKIRSDLAQLQTKADQTEASIKATSSAELSGNASTELGAERGLKALTGFSGKSRDEVERVFQSKHNKLEQLDKWLPSLKKQIREFFEISDKVSAIFLQIDDLYQLRQEDQPFVVDYIHRLCKDLPLFFKMATLRHASILFVQREGQPIGAQERHDFQPINIDYTFADFRRTRDQNKRIFQAFGKLAGLKNDQVDGLFKGQGFDRLVLAGGGVPRDTLSLFLEVLSEVQADKHGDGRIGKDDVRILSKQNFERRIDELKHDSGAAQQEPLIKGIYVIREFCLDKKSNVFLVSERTLQQKDEFRGLIYRLLDYRIIHSGATALSHKSHEGAYQTFAIDIGCYAHLRKHQGKFNEVDLSATDAKEKLRSAPILELGIFEDSFSKAPDDAEARLVAEEAEA
jgi:hypothetical protein